MNFGNIVIMMNKFGSKSGDFAQRGFAQRGSKSGDFAQRGTPQTSNLIKQKNRRSMVKMKY